MAREEAALAETEPLELCRSPWERNFLIRIARTFCFSTNGHCIYFTSPSEMQKITLSAEISECLTEMLGVLFMPCDTPEAPKKSFLMNLFCGGGNQLDREELFGESSSGKGSNWVAKYSAGTAGMSQTMERAGGVCSEIGRAKMLALERREKLSQTEEATERMRDEAEEFARSSHQLSLKYKNKKWYQF